MTEVYRYDSAVLTVGGVEVPVSNVTHSFADVAKPELWPRVTSPVTFTTTLELSPEQAAEWQKVIKDLCPPVRLTRRQKKWRRRMNDWVRKMTARRRDSHTRWMSEGYIRSFFHYRALEELCE